MSDRTAIWETLFRRATAIVDSAVAAGMPDDWSLGGGTMLMLDFRHRFSKDIDIFVPDPQCLGFLTPRLNGAAEVDTKAYDEQAQSLKIYYEEGEVDFVVALPVTRNPFVRREVLGRQTLLETPLEIVAKKLHFRAADFRARDLFDLAMVLERVAGAAATLSPFIAAQQAALRQRFTTRERFLREDFSAIDALDYGPTFDACLDVVWQASGLALLG